MLDLQPKLWFIWLFCIIVQCAWSAASALSSSDQIYFGDNGSGLCTNVRRRLQLSAEQGVLSANYYALRGYCEWFIKGVPAKFVSLTIEGDFFGLLHVFNGNSTKSPLLAVLSGDSDVQPDYLITDSGMAYILLSWTTTGDSGTIHRQSAFSANYSVTDCPLNCSGHGFCQSKTSTKQSGRCVCDSEWSGVACQRAVVCFAQPISAAFGSATLTPTILAATTAPALPLSLTSSLATPTRKCPCKSFRLGETCEFTLQPTASALLLQSCWIKLFDADSFVWEGESLEDLPSPRAGHSFVFLKDLNSLFLFGGYNFAGSILSDLWRFNLHLNSWLRIIPVGTSVPSGRFGHGCTASNDGFYIFGGVVAPISNLSISNEFWFFNAVANLWTAIVTVSPMAAANSDVPPALAYPSLTFADSEQRLYVFGGLNERLEFSTAMFVFSVATPLSTTRWAKISYANAIASGTVLRRFGHSTVFVAASLASRPSGRLFVFGGVTQAAGSWSLSDTIAMFDTASRLWAVLKAASSPTMFSGRGFHSSTLVSNEYVAVYGGLMQRSTTLKQKRDADLILYDLRCNLWRTVSDILDVHLMPDSAANKPNARFAHATAVVNQTLFVFGGIGGQMKGDLWTFDLRLALSDTVSTVCSKFVESTVCLSNVNCAWCERVNQSANSGRCIQKKGSCSYADSFRLRTDVCPGVCSALSDCFSCASVGLNCSWCARTRFCLSAQDFAINCLPLNEMVGSNAESSATVTSPRLCFNSSAAASAKGLSVLSYEAAANFSDPDSADIISGDLKLSVGQQLKPALLRSFNQTERFWLELSGFLHLTEKQFALLYAGRLVRIFIRASGLDTIFVRLGNQSNATEILSETFNSKQRYYSFQIPKHFWTAANNQLVSASKTIAIIGNSTLVGSAESLASVSTCFVTLLLSQSISQLRHNVSASFRLFWDQFVPINLTFFSPIFGDDCSTRKSCFVCLINVDCVWLADERACLFGPMAMSIVSLSNVVFQPLHCASCDHFTTCQDCVVNGCEWLLDEFVCARKGRFVNANVTNSLTDCPSKCSTRSNCIDCLSVSDGCGWCSSEQLCIPSYALPLFGGVTGHCVVWKSKHSEFKSDSDSDSAVADLCFGCSALKTCTACLRQLHCGWCYSASNPQLGFCFASEFATTNVSSEVCASNISNNFPVSDGLWTYTQCPEVDECHLGLHTCLPNVSSCIDTNDGFQCRCNQPGFQGDGITHCSKTCLQKCIHGRCGGAPNFICVCELGWTGEDCSVDCGCNGHSTCLKEKGICDECAHSTTGAFCAECASGFFGNATDPSVGCEQCQCGGLGDVSLGICDNRTGQCYCTEHAAGNNCDVCIDGYLKLTHDGRCYKACAGGIQLHAGVENNASRFLAIASNGASDSTDIQCIWILSLAAETSVLESLNSSTIPAFLSNSTSSNILALDLRWLNLTCGKEALSVYDGIPSFVLSGMVEDFGLTSETDSNTRLLQRLCGVLERSDLAERKHPQVVAESGTMTVLFSSVSNQQESSRTVVEKVALSCYQILKDAGSMSSAENCSRLASYNKQTFTYSPRWGGQDTSEMYDDLDTSNSFVRTAPSFSFWSNSVPRNAADLSFPDYVMSSRMIKDLAMDGLAWIFGGLVAADGPTNRLFVFVANSTEGSSVETFPVDLQTRLSEKDHVAAAVWPSPRYAHGMESLPAGGFIIAGGVGMNGKELNDSFVYNPSQNAWIKITNGEKLPPIAGCSLTLIPERQVVYLLGGYSAEAGFSRKIFVFDILKLAWSSHPTESLLLLPEIYNHVAIYSFRHASICLFGGHFFNGTNIAPSDFIFALRVASPLLQWSVLRNRGLPRRISANGYSSLSVVKNGFAVLPAGKRLSSEKPSLWLFHFSAAIWTPLDFAPLWDSARVSPASSRSFAKSASRCSDAPRVPLAASMISLQSSSSSIDTSALLLLETDPFAGPEAQGAFLTIVAIPADLCQFYSSNERICLSATGCSGCWSSGGIFLFCFDPTASGQRCAATAMSGAESLPAVDCTSRESCEECLSSDILSTSSTFQPCTWCACDDGHCIPSSRLCNAFENCSASNAVFKVSQCSSFLCSAASCASCQRLPSAAAGAAGSRCEWSEAPISSTLGSLQLSCRLISDSPSASLKPNSSLYASSNPDRTVAECSSRCSQHANCEDCTSSLRSADAGDGRCVWLPELNNCISQSSAQTLFSPHSAYLMWQACGSNCSQFQFCSTCLLHAGCGWCAMRANDADLSGKGICLAGGPQPAEGCSANWSSQAALRGFSSTGPSLFSWHSLAQSCPKEDACQNGHNSCIAPSEICVPLDAESGSQMSDAVDKHRKRVSSSASDYECACADGYAKQSSGNLCIPVCTPSCVHGWCSEPNKCSCDFGFAGSRCELQCNCSGKSNCLSSNPNYCIQCLNNTTGAHCEECSPGFIPFNTHCISCSAYCNGLSSECVSTNLSLPSPLSSLLRPMLTTVCQNCRANSAGNRCDSCKSGYFVRNLGSAFFCAKCMCGPNSLANICDKSDGSKCPCTNNTASSCSPLNGGPPCYSQQCSVCKPDYEGDPTNSFSPCFLQVRKPNQMTCFDATSSGLCAQNFQLTVLPANSSAFFVVRPQYTNVDLRVTVDVTRGQVDAFVGLHSRAFEVVYDTTLGRHAVNVANVQYAISNSNLAKKSRRRRSPRAAEAKPRRTRRQSSTNVKLLARIVEFDATSSYSSTSRPSEILNFNTLVSAYVVRRLRNRLILTFSSTDIGLAQLRPFVVIQATSGIADVRGSIFFSQNQPRMDLFIFFSVFFSCFFLLLLTAASTWRLQGVFNRRQNHRVENLELDRMISRPNTKFHFILSEDYQRIVDDVDYLLLDDPDDVCDAASKQKASKSSDAPAKHRRRSQPQHYNHESTSLGRIYPCCVQPLRNNQAAITTLLVQLPGGDRAPCKIAFGSALTCAKQKPKSVGATQMAAKAANAPRDQKHVVALPPGVSNDAASGEVSSDEFQPNVAFDLANRRAVLFPNAFQRRIHPAATVAQD